MGQVTINFLASSALSGIQIAFILNKAKEGNAVMIHKEAIKILMKSPFYFRIGLIDRIKLVKEFGELLRFSQTSEEDGSDKNHRSS